MVRGEAEGRQGTVARAAAAALLVCRRSMGRRAEGYRILWLGVQACKISWLWVQNSAARERRGVEEGCKGGGGVQGTLARA